MPPDFAQFPLAMLLVFGSAKLLAEVLERLHQPGIVGEILAGVLIGPSVLGWIKPSDFLAELAELGVMFLLFRVGLGVKASDLFRVGGTATVVAVLGVAAPFLLGWGILRLWGEPHIESVFMGAAMVATSVGITAQVLASKGLVDTRASRIILAAAVIDDVLGLLVLALVTSLARGHVDLLGLGFTAAVAAGFTIIVAAWGRRAILRVVPHVRGRMRLPEAQFALSMCLLFALSLAAVYAGVAAIIGAFLAGMALSESVSARVHDMTDGVTELLLPFFLAGIGLHLDVRVFGRSSMLALSLTILIAAVVSKLVGCGLGAYRLGRADAIRVGVGMIPRGEVGLVVAQIGQSMGVIAPPIYGVVVFMAVATTIIAPPLLAASCRGLEAEQRTTEQAA
jgi:Kef-type K+ transport system membrane component KefB